MKTKYDIAKGYHQLLVCLSKNIVTKAIKRPKTGFDDYGWRGVGTGSILFGIYSFLLGIVVIVRGETSSIIGTLIITILFGILPLYIGKKLIIDWT